jgi:hypothetical protein
VSPKLISKTTDLANGRVWRSATSLLLPVEMARCDELQGDTAVGQIILSPKFDSITYHSTVVERFIWFRFIPGLNFALCIKRNDITSDLALENTRTIVAFRYTPGQLIAKHFKIEKESEFFVFGIRVR